MNCIAAQLLPNLAVTFSLLLCGWLFFAPYTWTPVGWILWAWRKVRGRRPEPKASTLEAFDWGKRP